MSRRIVWFSCGAASAVAAKVALELFPTVEIVYCDTSADEHPDNARFMRDVGKWIERDITVISSSKYNSCDEVFETARYMSGIKGARCTMELKRIPRLKFQRDDDVHIFGFTAEETDRIEQFEWGNPFTKCDWVLRDRGYTKQECFSILRDEGITLPTLYLQGFRNNNCIGCVKATSPGYWNKVRALYPERFAERANRSRELGVRLVRVEGKRLFLDELPFDAKGNWKDLVVRENVSCGPQCSVEKEIS